MKERLELGQCGDLWGREGKCYRNKMKRESVVCVGAHVAKVHTVLAPTTHHKVSLAFFK